jgi:hypothetical protein
MEIAHALKVDITELLRFKPEPLFKTQVTVHRKKSSNESDSKNEDLDDFEYIEE